eukprot:7499548-Pyramimonas_sp.AAC.1
MDGLITPQRSVDRDSLKRAGRPSQRLRLRRSQAPALLHRSSDSPNAGGDAISNKREYLLVSIQVACLAARHKQIWAAGRFEPRRPRTRARLGRRRRPKAHGSIKNAEVGKSGANLRAAGDANGTRNASSVAVGYERDRNKWTLAGASPKNILKAPKQIAGNVLGPSGSCFCFSSLRRLAS